MCGATTENWCSNVNAENAANVATLVRENWINTGLKIIFFP